MSWEAVNWASRQKLKKSYEQIVLLVLANCADPNGEAFVKWPGRDHWWVYLSERTRLPKSSLFRHLNTLVALGLGERSVLVMEDGARRPTFKLNMAAAFDIDLAEDEHRYLAAIGKVSSDSQSPVGTEHDDGFEGHENDSDISGSHDDENASASQSPVGTGNPRAQSPVGTDPFPVRRLQEDSLLVPKDSPLPPSGGPAAGPSFDDFRKVWLKPIDRMSLAERAWDHTPTAKRGEAITAARGYFVFVAQQPRKDFAVVSAQTFLREASGWQQWLRYAPDDDGKAASVTTAYPVGGAEGKAIVALHLIAGLQSFLEGVMIRQGIVSFRLPITDQLLKLAEAPPQADWQPLNREQAGAWEGFLRERITVQTRKRMTEGMRAPWPFPPSVNGTLYPWALSNSDLDALASEGQR